MRKRNLKYNQKTVVILLALVLVLVLVAAWVVMQRSKKSSHTVTPSPSGATSNNDTTTHAGPEHDTTPSPTTLPSNPSHPTTSTLAKPGGQLLSSRTAPMSANEESTCTSVAGASCYLQATMNGKVVVLSASKTITADEQGVILDWPVSKLAPGSWAVQAVASKDGQRALSDPWTLTVTQ